MPESTKQQRKPQAQHRTAKIRENINLFAVSLALAIVVWLFAKITESEEAGLTIPVVVTPEDPRIEVRVSPDHMPVILRYPKDMRNYITSGNFYFAVDISDLRDQLGLDWVSKTEPMNEKNFVANVRGARGLTLVKVGAANNTVRVEARWKAQPAIVVPDVVGAEQIPQGYQLVSPVRVDTQEVWVTAKPEVLVTLPRDDITSKIKLFTNKIDVSNRTEGGLFTVPIKLPPGVEIVHPKTSTVEVNIGIQEIQTVREIRGVKIDFAAVAPESVKVEYKDKQANVTVFGPQSLLPKVTPDMIEINFVRPPQEVPGTSHEVPLEAHFSPAAPEDIKSKLTIRSIEPRTITVRYVPQDSANTTR